MTWSKELFQEAFNKLSARAATDLEFRQLCVSDIHAAILLESGMEVPASFKIGVLDQSAYRMSVILPPVSLEPNELSEGELESIAGGIKSNPIGDYVNQGGGSSSSNHEFAEQLAVGAIVVGVVAIAAADKFKSL